MSGLRTGRKARPRAPLLARQRIRLPSQVPKSFTARGFLVLLSIAIWIASIAIVVGASRKADKWPKRKKVLIGVAMVVPTIIVATVLSQLLALDIGARSSAGSTVAMAIGSVLLALFIVLYLVFAAIYKRFGGHG